MSTVFSLFCTGEVSEWLRGECNKSFVIAAEADAVHRDDLCWIKGIVYEHLGISSHMWSLYIDPHNMIDIYKMLTLSKLVANFNDTVLPEPNLPFQNFYHKFRQISLEVILGRRLWLIGFNSGKNLCLPAGHSKVMLACRALAGHF